MSPKMQPFWYFLKPPITYYDLPVNLFKGYTGDWATYGLSPWLNTNDADDSWIGWFGGSLTFIKAWWFDKTGLTSFSKVEHHIIARQTEVWTESDGIYLSTDDVNYNYVWGIGVADPNWLDYYYDVTSILNTIAKINAASMALNNLSGRGAHITFSFLRVYI